MWAVILKDYNYDRLQHVTASIPMLVVYSCKDSRRLSLSALPIPVNSESAVVDPARQLPPLTSFQHHFDNLVEFRHRTQGLTTPSTHIHMTKFSPSYIVSLFNLFLWAYLAGTGMPYAGLMGMHVMSVGQQCNIHYCILVRMSVSVLISPAHSSPLSFNSLKERSCIIGCLLCLGFPLCS